MVRRAKRAVAMQTGDLFVSRERLFARLDQLEQRAIWVQGPTGAGKTVLLRLYTRRSTAAVLWLAIDATVAAPDGFFAALSLCAQRAGCGDLPQFAGEHRHAPEKWLRHCVEGIARQAPGAMLVIDDAHRLLPSLAPLLTSLIAACAGRLRLFFAAQELPTGLETSLAEARLVVIGHEHLALDEAEALELARRLGTADALAAPLRARTSGWAAGLMLALQLAQGTSLADAQRRLDVPLAGLVHGGVLQGVPRQTMAALAALAPARRIPLALATCGAPWAQAVAELERLSERGLFVERLDDDLCLHDLLRNALLLEPPAEADRGAAIQSLSDAGRLDLALACLVAMPDAGDRLRLWLHERAQDVLCRDDVGALVAMILDCGAALPPAVRLWCARGAMATDLALADRTAEAAWSALDVAADAAAMRCCCGVGLLTQSVLLDAQRLQTWQERLAHLPAATAEELQSAPLLEASARLVEHVLQPSRPNTPELEALHATLHRTLLGPQPPQEAILAASVLVYALLQLRRRYDVPAMLEQIEGTGWFGRVPAHAQIEWHVNKGYTLRGLGRAEQAAASFATACALARQQCTPALLRSALAGQARALLTMGDVSGAEAALNEAGTISVNAGGHWRVEELSLRAWLELARARPLRALSAIETADSLLSDLGLAPTHTLQLDHAQVLFALDRHDAALALAEKAARSAEGAVRDMAECTWQLLRAQTLWPHERPSAQAALREAVTLIEQRRWTNFLSLLPREAGLAAHRALQGGEPVDAIRDAIRERRLPAPADAGAEWPWPLRVFVVGHWRLERFDELVSFQGKVQRKPLELLKFLACAREQSADHATVCAALWPDAEGHAARRSLEMATARLREILGNSNWLRVADGRTRLDREHVWSDAQAFWRACAAAEQAGERGASAADAREAAEAMLTLHRGVLLEGDDETPWVLGARERHRAAFVRATRAVVNTLHAHRQQDLGIALLEQAIAAEPLAEELAQRLMLTYTQRGQPAEALRVYRQLRQMLSALIGTQPSAASEQLRQSIVGQPKAGRTS